MEIEIDIGNIHAIEIQKSSVSSRREIRDDIRLRKENQRLEIGNWRNWTFSLESMAMGRTRRWN